MKATYSIGTTFAGGGIGRLALQATRGIERHGLLQRVLCDAARPSDIPAERIRALGLPGRALRRAAVNDPSGLLSYTQALLFDVWAARQLEAGDLLHVWGNWGLRTLHRARELGMTTIVERASAHPRAQATLLQAEYERWGCRIRQLEQNIVRGSAEIELADYTLIPSDFVRQTFRDLGFPQQRLLQLPFAVDSQRFQPAPPGERRPFRALFVGQVGFRKGLPYLLEAWQRLGWHDAELWVVGEVEAVFKPFMARWASLPGLRRIGYTADLPGLYRQADLFAFPTIEEGSALVTYEAMACGLPLLTTSHAGSVARHEQEGLLVPIRDVEALAAGLERLRGDHRLRQELGRAGRERVAALSWENYGDRLAALYQRVGGHG